MLMNALLQQFITEARDLLEEAANSLLALETSPQDKDGVNAVFRAAHTLKGSTGLFDVLPMTKVVHAAEDILDAVKADKVKINAELIDLLLEAFDQVSIWIDDLESSEALSSSADAIGSLVSGRLRDWLTTADGQERSASTLLVSDAPVNNSVDSHDAQVIADWLSVFDPKIRAKAFELAVQGYSVVTLSYTPEAECYFKGEDPFGLLLQLPGLMGVKAQLAHADVVSAETDVYKANVSLFAVAQVELSEAEHLLRYVEDQVSLSVPPAQAWLIPYGEVDKDSILNDIVEKMDQCISVHDLENLIISISVAKDIVRANSWASHVLALMQLVSEAKHEQSFDWLTSLKDSLVTGELPNWSSSDLTVKDMPSTLLSSNNSQLKQQIVPSSDAESIAVIVGLQIALLQAPILPELRLGKIVSVAKIIENLIHRINQPELCQSWLAVVAKAKANLQTEMLVQWLEQSALNQPYAVHFVSPDLPSTKRVSETSAQALLDIQRKVLALAPQDDPILAGRLTSVKQVISKLFEGQNQAGALIGLDSVVTDSINSHSCEPLLAWLDQQTLIGQVSSSINAATELATDTSAASQESNNTLTHEVANTEAVSSGISSDSAVAKTLRVEQASVDKLGDLIGELVVAKNAMPYLAQRAERDFGVPELAKLLKEQFNVVDRLTQELQGTIMKVQMLPVSQIFQRFPRLVRDISRKLGKKINLVLEGEETQADKTVIEVMSDPMIHMVRNSLDHGLETPDVRLAAGKSEIGTIKLKAYQEGDSVFIEIQDDGRGINPNVVKQKALEKGVISSEQAQTMTDQEAIYLIFHPGFSTNDSVTDLSGRGVGMDVVRSTIERIGGTLKVHSEVGKGTNIKLSLPLSMAVSHVMEVQMVDQIFGIPMDIVVETARLSPNQINRIKQREAFVWRSRLVPLVRLRHTMRLPKHTPRSDGSESVLVVRKDGGLIGLVVDDFRSKAEVIMKPLEGPLSGIPIYAGSALLGDGSVMLVINVSGITL